MLAFGRVIIGQAYVPSSAIFLTFATVTYITVGVSKATV